MIPFPPARELLPHGGGMALLGSVLDHGPTHTVCSVDCAESELFRGSDGSVPAWLAIEYMAQCIGAHVGLEKHARGEGPNVGFFVGSRCIVLHADHFAPGERVRVRADALRRGGGLVVFACRVEREADAAVLAEGQLSVFEPRNPQARFGGPQP
jgi:predicted hotdog family 3-hydroxylacyl-ACP dehydratase